ncbi:hypothetical protein [Corynebacterium sp.]|uniref:hypothetical protein n=1 Tax=Corynebacterium sp. TaxID=1720 RepID=UPI0026DAA28C|nr:hypothetical protein [Corynebacterium sp.]MDO5076059.1 hypothetical protein [Corynebacterium sp.]
MHTELAEKLQHSRFYGSKTQTITGVEVVQSQPLGSATHCIVRASRNGDSDLYQLCIDAASNDVFATEDVVNHYGAALQDGSVMGTVHARRTPLLPANATGRSLGAEQSNTSLVFGGELLVKVFRKLQPGINPDVELLNGLAETGCEYVPRLQGWVSQHIDGQEYVTALLQDFAAGSRPGWDTALEFANEGRSFAAEAKLLGRATAAVHEDLAKFFGTQTVPGRALAHKLHTRLNSLADEIPQLREFAPHAAKLYDAVSDAEATMQRVHGDYHLGQVLRTADRYLLIDFEGEPARPLAERRQMDCAVRDLAGMMRSFDYAAQLATDAPSGWADEASAALLEGYGGDHQALMNAYLMDKLLYEVAYELNNRPDWAYIPLGGLARLLRSL